jgi:serine/threonine-protein kinase
VWEARHVRLPDKRVAIKLIVGDNEQEELFARFRREAEITSKLGHPNIVGVLDFNTLPTGAPFIVLELLVGESLADRLRRGPIPLPQALDIARQIGSALHAAHRAEIVHRDLKPDNVFLIPSPEGGPDQIKVLDFGISKMRSGTATNKTQDATMLGTPQYMSPEQANGENSKVDARSDVWALGAIVYEMITGRCAFPGESLATVVVRIVAQPSPSLREVPGVPSHVVAAVDRALAKDPDERFSDVRQLVSALTGAPLDSAFHQTDLTLS